MISSLLLLLGFIVNEFISGKKLIINSGKNLGISCNDCLEMENILVALEYSFENNENHTILLSDTDHQVSAVVTQKYLSQKPGRSLYFVENPFDSQREIKIEGVNSLSRIVFSERLVSLMVTKIIVKFSSLSLVFNTINNLPNLSTCFLCCFSKDTQPLVLSLIKIDIKTDVTQNLNQNFNNYSLIKIRGPQFNVEIKNLNIFSNALRPFMNFIDVEGSLNQPIREDLTIISIADSIIVASGQRKLISFYYIGTSIELINVKYDNVKSSQLYVLNSKITFKNCQLTLIHNIELLTLGYFFLKAFGSSVNITETSVQGIYIAGDATIYGDYSLVEIETSSNFSFTSSSIKSLKLGNVKNKFLLLIYFKIIRLDFLCQGI